MVQSVNSTISSVSVHIQMSSQQPLHQAGVEDFLRLCCTGCRCHHLLVVDETCDAKLPRERIVLDVPPDDLRFVYVGG